MTTTTAPKTKKLTRSQQMTADLTALVKARNALIVINSREEARVELSLMDAAATVGAALYFWDAAAGAQTAKGEVVDPAGDPDAVLTRISSTKERALWVLRDLTQWLNNPITTRRLRNLARSLPSSERKEARTIILLTTGAQPLPAELLGHAVVLDWPMPDREEIGAILDAVIATLPEEIAATVRNGKREAAIDAAVGLSAEEAGSTFSKSLVTMKTIDAKAIVAEKKRVIAREKVLEYIEVDPRGLEAVAGLEELKAWLHTRRGAFSQAARDFGLPAPKGALFVGPPGTGKSLTAKALAASWSMPLLKLDMGALKSKWVGESEGNIRKALAVAETVAPCVLWIDEIEKAMAGATQGAADGGVSADALGVILTWMQDRKADVFVVATANDVSALPAPLLRKGRFDEIFFVDNPNEEERAAIVRTTLKGYNRTVDGIDLDAIVAATSDYAGVEVATLIPTALFTAFNDGSRALRTEDLLQAAKETVPISKTMSEQLKRLRDWAGEGRARPATRKAAAKAVSTARKLDL